MRERKKKSDSKPWYMVEVDMVVCTLEPDAEESCDVPEYVGWVTLSDAIRKLDEYGPWDSADHGSHARTGEGREAMHVVYFYPADGYTDPRTGVEERIQLLMLARPDVANWLIDYAMNFDRQDRRKTGIWVGKWEERSRLHISVYFGKAGDPDSSIEIAEWWDDDARALFEDGFLDARDIEGSAEEYVTSLGLWAE